MREWLPAIAKAIGAPPPRHVPRWVGRLLGAHIVALMCEIRGASNERARRELEWTPTWPTWREGIPALAARKESSRYAAIRARCTSRRVAPRRRARRGGGAARASAASPRLGNAVAACPWTTMQVGGRVHDGGARSASPATGCDGARRATRVRLGTPGRTGVCPAAPAG